MYEAACRLCVLSIRILESCSTGWRPNRTSKIEGRAMAEANLSLNDRTNGRGEQAGLRMLHRTQFLNAMARLIPSDTAS